LCSDNAAKKIPSDSSFLQTCDSRRGVEIDGIYYYCWFTAIAAECGEHLVDLNTALLAYKSIRAMEDRRYISIRPSTGIYPGERGTENEVTFESPAILTELTCHPSSSSSSGRSSSPRITITKTPANTPIAPGRKASSSNEDKGSNWASIGTINHSFDTKRNRNPLFSPIPSIGGKRVSSTSSLFRD